MTLRVTGDDGTFHDFAPPITVEPGDGGPPPPPEDPPIGDPPDPDAQTADTFDWKARVKDPKTGRPVEYGTFPYRRTPIVLASGDEHPGYEDIDRDGYRAAGCCITNPDGDYIARVVLAGGYNPSINAVVMDKGFSDGAVRWYDLSITDPMPRESNDLPVREATGTASVDGACDLDLVHRPTGTVVDHRPYSALVADPSVTFAVTETLDEPFDDQGRAAPPGGAVHEVQSRVEITFWYQGLEAHHYYFDSMHEDYYWHVTEK